jgi:hypothetical protein
MAISTEPIGSIPRAHALIEGLRSFGEGRISRSALTRGNRAARVDNLR